MNTRLNKMRIVEVTDELSTSTIELDSISGDPEIEYERPSSRGYRGNGRCLIVFSFNRTGISIVSATVGLFVVAVLKRLLLDW